MRERVSEYRGEQIVATPRARRVSTPYVQLHTGAASFWTSRFSRSLTDSLTQMRSTTATWAHPVIKSPVVLVLLGTSDRQLRLRMNEAMACTSAATAAATTKLQKARLVRPILGIKTAAATSVYAHAAAVMADGNS